MTVTVASVRAALRALAAPAPPDEVVREFDEALEAEFDRAVAEIAKLLPDDPPPDDEPDVRYSEDQPRDDQGQWTDGGGSSSSGGGSAAPAVGVTIARAPRGQRALGDEPSGGKVITKKETGNIAEAAAVAYMRKKGWDNARRVEVPGGRNNLPIDVVYDHAAAEVKGGLSTNRKDARKWRLTIGQPGKAETAWLKTASPAAKAKWNAGKRARIVARKKAMVAALSKAKGYRVKLQTVTAVVNTKTRLVDIHVFDGVHPSIRWDSPEAKKAYVGTFRYSETGRKAVDVDAIIARIFAEAKYSDDQPRDDSGRWTDGGSGGRGRRAETSSVAGAGGPRATVYHATPLGAAKSIMRSGLKRGEAWQGRKPSVYFTETADGAHAYGRVLAGYHTAFDPDSKTGYAIVEFDVPAGAVPDKYDRMAANVRKLKPWRVERDVPASAIRAVHLVPGGKGKVTQTLRPGKKNAAPAVGFAVVLTLEPSEATVIASDERAYDWASIAPMLRDALAAAP